MDEKPANYRGGKKQEISDDELYQQITETERDMKRAAKALEFEEAAMWRDRLAQLRQQWNERFGSRSDAAMKTMKSGRKRINRQFKKEYNQMILKGENHIGFCIPFYIPMEVLWKKESLFREPDRIICRISV